VNDALIVGSLTALVAPKQFAYDRSMTAHPELRRLAQTIGDASRVGMLALLMEGRALTAKELAYGAAVEPATASTHLRRLEQDGLVSVCQQGRHKYFRLASPQVAQLVESLLVLAPSRPIADGRAEPIRQARFCYDHLAGRLGVALTEALVERELLDVAEREFVPTAAGEAWFADLGVNLAALRRSRRQFAARCIDWSERRDHLAGALGAALAERLQNNGWITRQKHSRVVTLTDAGQAGLAERLGVHPT